MTRPPTLTITSSDTRTPADDASGEALRALLAPHVELLPHEILGESPGVLGARLDRLRDERARCVIVTGGTGVAPRDRTIEEIVPRLDKVLDGFGEAFRRLSFEQIGARSILSRALAGTMGTTFVVALPGSRKAVELGVTALVIPVVGHVIDLLDGKTKHGGSTT